MGQRWCGSEDVLAALELGGAPAAPAAAPPQTVTPQPTRDGRDQSDLHQRILDRLGPSPLGEDQLLRDLAISPAEAAADLLTLELDGKIKRAPGGLLSRL